MKSFYAPTEICMTENARESLVEYLDKSAYQGGTWLFTDKRISETEYFHKTFDGFAFSGKVILEGSEEPTTGVVDQIMLDYGKSFYSSHITCIVAVGGGTVLDIAKAVSVLASIKGNASAIYQGFDTVAHTCIPVITIPTTFCGSEVTGTAVLINEIKAMKLVINSRRIIPKQTILDPNFLTTLPKALRLMSGIDAYVHAFESYFGKKATDISRVHSLYAMDRIDKFLPFSVKKLDDLDVLKELQQASAMAGNAIMNAGTGVIHAMSYPLGVYMGIPHCKAVAMLFPKVLAHAQGQNLLDMFWYPELGLAREINDFYEANGVLFDSVDCGPEKLQTMTTDAFKLSSAMENTPFKVDEKFVTDVYRSNRLA
jgi:alcohol dehydrogenase class IV